MRGLIAVALAFALAGCLDGNEGVPDPETSAGLDAPAPPPGYEFVCGPATVARAEGVCATRIASAGNQLTEPSLAVHPNDPRILAVAAHGVGTASLVAGGRLVVPLLFVSEDGGTSWRESTVPFAPLAGVPGDFYSDPAVVFTPNGTLVLAGLRVAQGALAHPPIVLAMASKDLGATWGEVQEFGEGGRNDREWLSLGPDGVVYLSWQEYPETSHVAWSADEGTTWTVLEETPQGCFTGSAVAFVAGQPWFACQQEADGKAGVNVFRILREEGRLEQVSRITDMYSIAPRVLEGPDGSVVVTGFWDQVARSADGGLTWDDARSVRDLVTVEDAWPQGQTYVYWSAIDGNALHLMLAYFHRFPTHNPSDEHWVAHVVLDATTLQSVQEARLTPGGPEAAGVDNAGSAVPSLGDDWYQLLASGGEVRMAWTWAGGIDVGHAVGQ
jgi:hypothetical protein